MAKTPPKRRRGRSRRSGLYREFRFLIDAFSPETFPMWRLAEYMGDLATLLGEQEHVHFNRLAEGSTAIVHRIDWEAVPKVRQRAKAVARHDAPTDAADAFEKLNQRLAQDNASACLLTDEGAKVLAFPGRNRKGEPEYGPFNEIGELIGQVIMVGGKNDPVPVHIQDGDIVHLCEAKRDVAKTLAPLIFGPTLRVNGVGRWFRNASGAWEMRSFRINSYQELDQSSLRSVVKTLRAIPAGWKNRRDSLLQLKKIREG